MNLASKPSPADLSRKTPFVLALLRSFHSTLFYEEVRKNWKGRGFLYLFLLSSFVALAQTAATSQTYDEFVDEELPVIVSRMPEVKIEKGEAMIEAEQPVVLEAKGNPVAIFDTTGKVTSLEDSEAIFLVTRNRIHFRGIGNSVTETSLSEFGNMTLTGESVVNAASQIGSLVPLFVYPVVLILGYLFRLVQVFAFATMGRAILAKVPQASQRLDRDAVYRLVAVSLTPAAVIEVVFYLADVDFPFLGLFYQVVAAAYIIQTLRTASRQPMAPESQA